MDWSFEDHKMYDAFSKDSTDFNFRNPNNFQISCKKFEAFHYLSSLYHSNFDKQIQWKLNLNLIKTTRSCIKAYIRVCLKIIKSTRWFLLIEFGYWQKKLKLTAAVWSKYINIIKNPQRSSTFGIFCDSTFGFIAKKYCNQQKLKSPNRKPTITTTMK